MEGRDDRRTRKGGGAIAAVTSVTGGKELIVRVSLEGSCLSWLGFAGQSRYGLGPCLTLRTRVYGGRAYPCHVVKLPKKSHRHCPSGRNVKKKSPWRAFRLPRHQLLCRRPLAGSGRSTDITPCGVYLWLESRANKLTLRIAWILPLRHSAAAERVDSSSVSQVLTGCCRWPVSRDIDVCGWLKLEKSFITTENSPLPLLSTLVS